MVPVGSILKAAVLVVAFTTDGEGLPYQQEAMYPPESLSSLCDRVIRYGEANNIFERSTPASVLSDLKAQIIIARSTLLVLKNDQEDAAKGAMAEIMLGRCILHLAILAKMETTPLHRCLPTGDSDHTPIWDHVDEYVSDLEVAIASHCYGDPLISGAIAQVYRCFKDAARYYLHKQGAQCLEVALTNLERKAVAA